MQQATAVLGWLAPFYERPLNHPEVQRPCRYLLLQQAREHQVPTQAEEPEAEQQSYLWQSHLPPRWVATISVHGRP